jgi:hypothetical protein
VKTGCLPLEHGKRGSHALQGPVCQVHKGETKRLRRRESIFGTHRSRVSVHASHGALTLQSLVAHRRSPSLTLLARCEALKWHVVGERESELRADFSSLMSPRDYFSCPELTPLWA